MSQRSKKPTGKPVKSPVEAPKRNREFLKYLITQKWLTAASFVFSLVLFLVLKYCFPVPDFFLDSFSYVQDSVLELDITYRPLGYSHFLTFCHYFSTSANLPVVFQFILFFISSVFCFLSCDYLFGFPAKWKIVVLFLTLFNPLLIFQTNLISSDSLFSSLTVIWFTLCLWIIRRRSWGLLIAQIVFLYLCFELRYTAIFYPVVAIIVMAISKGSPVYKLTGIAVTLLLIFSIVEHQKQLHDRRMGVRVFSGFSGWQIGNNVLCYYKEANVNRDDLEGEPKIIDSFVRMHIDSLYKENYIGTQYLWEKKSPFKYYLATKMQRSKATYFYQWNVVSKDLGEYGWAVIKQNPMAYVKYFMIRNFKNCFLFPDGEVMKNYDFFKSEVPDMTKKWFVKLNMLYCKYPNLQKKIFSVYPVLSFILNLANALVLVIAAIVLLIYRKKADNDTLGMFVSWLVFYCGYVAFCIFSTVVLLRYLNPLFTLGLIMPFIIVRQLVRLKQQQAV